LLADGSVLRFYEGMIKSRSTVSNPGYSARDFELYDEQMPVRRYKLLLQALLKRRGSGIRQAIAETLGNTRGFVTQITSPAYPLALPAQHVRTIIDMAQMSPNEERMFLDAYLQAHPDRASEVLGRSVDGGSSRTISIRIPLLSSPVAQQRLEALIERFARDVAATMAEAESELAAASNASAA
jgi:hypothetical protein